jgi:hypothetical protein
MINCVPWAIQAGCGMFATSASTVGQLFEQGGFFSNRPSNDQIHVEVRRRRRDRSAIAVTDCDSRIACVARPLRRGVSAHEMPRFGAKSPQKRWPAAIPSGVPRQTIGRPAQQIPLGEESDATTRRYPAATKTIATNKMVPDGWAIRSGSVASTTTSEGEATRPERALARC